MLQEQLTIETILRTMIAELEKYNVPIHIDHNNNLAAHITLESLALDSLDILQFAMDVEDSLGKRIDIVDFPPDATLLEIAKVIQQSP